jgi:hypothetical protein
LILDRRVTRRNKAPGGFVVASRLREGRGSFEKLAVMEASKATLNDESLFWVIGECREAPPRVR